MTTLRIAIYARFSNEELQDARSIADQVRLCRDHVARLFPGAPADVVDVYADAGISGALLRQRPEANRLLADARAGRFDAVLAEDLDRVSRDLEHVAGLWKRLVDAGVRLFTVADGEVGELHIGLRGTMNMVELRKLAAKTRRGLAGRARAGRNPGGLAYGYRVVRALDDRGELVRGDLAIDPAKAEVVRRIFADYLAGAAPRTIARRLNADCVASPRGREWNASTIGGQPARQTGILCNPIYVGRIVWGRQTFRRDPDSGTRRSRLMPAADHVTAERPDLRIIDQADWERAQALRARFARLAGHGAGQALNRTHRPRYLFSGLAACGRCGAAYTVAAQNRLQCTAYREGRSCANNRTIRATELAERVLGTIRERLIAPELLGPMLEAYRRERRRLAASAAHDQGAAEAQLARLDRQIARVVDAIADEGHRQGLGAKLDTLESERAALAARLAAARRARDPVELHPGAVARFRASIERLQQALEQDGHTAEAVAILRNLVRRIEVHPGPKRGQVDLQAVFARPAVLQIALGEIPTAANYGLAGSGGANSPSPSSDDEVTLACLPAAGRRRAA